MGSPDRGSRRSPLGVEQPTEVSRSDHRGPVVRFRHPLQHGRTGLDGRDARQNACMPSVQVRNVPEHVQRRSYAAPTRRSVAAAVPHRVRDRARGNSTLEEMLERIAQRPKGRLSRRDATASVEDARDRRLRVGARLLWSPTAEPTATRSATDFAARQSWARPAPDRGGLRDPPASRAPLLTVGQADQAIENLLDLPLTIYPTAPCSIGSGRCLPSTPTSRSDSPPSSTTSRSTSRRSPPSCNESSHERASRTTNERRSRRSTGAEPARPATTAKLTSPSTTTLPCRCKRAHSP